MTELPAGLKRHPWNTRFDWADAEGDRLRLTEKQVAAFDEDGFVVLYGLFNRALIDEVRAATDELERAVDNDLVAAGGRRSISERGAITFSQHLVTRSGLLRDFARHPVLADIATDLVGPDVNLYWDQAVYKKPEKPRRFPWHQDNGYTFVVPQQYLTCWVPLVEATVHNGCPQVAPGLHKWGTLEHEYVEPLGWQCFAEPPVEARPAPVSPGDVVVFSSLAPHLTGPNLTDQVRKAYILQYAPVGAEVLEGSPSAGVPSGSRRCDDPERQFPVVRSGTAVLKGA